MKKIIILLLVALSFPTFGQDFKPNRSKVEFRDSVKFNKNVAFIKDIKVGANGVTIDSITTDGTNIFFYHNSSVLNAVGGTGSAAWGVITGTLSNQTDLNAALGAKADTNDLSDYVPKTTTVNGHALSGNVSVTASDVSLGNVTNESKATMFTSPTITGTPTIAGYVPTSRAVNGHALTGNVSVTATDVGLGSVDNTADADKPISDLTQAALDLKLTSADTIYLSNRIDTNKAVLDNGASFTSVFHYDSSTDSVATKAELRAIIGGDYTAYTDSIKVAASAPATGNIYLDTALNRLRYKSGLYWYSLAVQDSTLITPARTYLDAINDNTPKGWYIAEDAYLTRDGTDSVYVWEDVSAANNDLTAAANTPKQPIFVTDHVHFDGIGNYMMKAFTWAQPNVIFAVVRQDGWTYGDKIIHNTGTGVLYIEQVATTPQIRVGSSAGSSSASGDLATNTWGIVEMIVTDNAGVLKVDDHDVLAFDPNAYTMGGLCIGGSDAPDAFAHCSFKEIICLSSIPTAEDIALIYAYLVTKL